MKRTLLIAIIAIACYWMVFSTISYPLIVIPHAEKAFSGPTYNEISESENYYYSEVCNPKKQQLPIYNISDIPKNYYHAEIPDCANDVVELDHLLSNIKYPLAFEPGIFDCSESAAFLERYLENLGYDAVIMTGARFFEGKKRYHAWVEVRNITLDQSGNPVAMHINRHEDTTYFALMSFHYQEDQAYYEDIYEACESRWGFNEWDWWNAAQLG